jgi:intracellular septation protein
MKLLRDFLPLALFFAVYKLKDLQWATAALIAATLASLLYTYIRERKLAWNPLISGVLVAFFGGLTLLLKDPIYIKMKPTLLNLFCALILFGGLAWRKSLVKPLLASAISLTETGWRQLTIRWAVFFVFLAGLNEYIWRSYSEDFWVSFKVFGMLPLTLIFMLMQIPLLQRHEVKLDAND